MQIRRRTIKRWLHDIEIGWGSRALRSVRTISPLLRTADPDDLHIIGRHLCLDGHALDDVLGWFQLLATRSHGCRRLLRRGGVYALASGWAEGALRDRQPDVPVAPLDVLRLRVRQQTAEVLSSGDTPTRTLALLVVETDGHPDSVAFVVERVRTVFTAGETMSVMPNGKVVLLVTRTADIHDRTQRLGDQFRRHDRFQDSPVRMWIEPLATMPDHIDSHLLGLAS